MPLVPAVLALLLPACRCSPGSPGGSGGGTHSYTVRAEILRLPDPARPGTEMVVRHEAIDDFVDGFGTVVGMDAMEMSFPVMPPLSTGGLAVGDLVSVQFTVDFGQESLAVERLDRLPPGTALRFRPAHPRPKGQKP